MDITTQPSAVSCDSEEGLCFDLEMASLYIKYPDLIFENDRDEVEGKSHGRSDEDPQRFESPVSTTDEGDSSWISQSTNQTTPLRPIDLSTIFQEPVEDDHQTFTSLLRKSDLPQKTMEYYKGVACRMLQIGGLLFPPEPGHMSRETPALVLRLCRTIMSLLGYSSSKIDGQRHNIVYIRSLGPFTVQMDAIDDLWSNYKQMATLVINYTASPSYRELRVIEALLAVFDTYVYHAALHSTDTTIGGSQVRICLDSIYSTLQEFVQKYRAWCMDMRKIKVSHMQPAMEKILASDRIIDEIATLEDRKKVANGSPSHQVVTGTVIESLSEGARPKRLEACRLKTRFKRELTI